MDQKSKGQSMVEFALIFPLLLLVLLTLIDGALLMQGYLAVNHAAREAARFAVAYQPNQGECMDSDGDGVGTDEPWPYCPSPGYTEDPYESESDYFSRRIRLIKMRATEEAQGLRMSAICDDNPSANCIENNMDEEGMFGVQVWGLPSFEDPAQEDHPGLRGLTVRVRVIHNVPLAIFAPFLPNDYVRVGASAEMINEGVQVGYGNLAPPTIGAPTIDPDTTPQNTVTPVDTPTTGPSPTPTPLPVYNLELDFETATNVLPEEREHNFGAHVTNPEGQNVGGAQVTFRTDEGSFHYSGSGAQVETLSTGADGWARLNIYANEPTTANIEAWLDYDGDLVVDADEPSDTATKIWEATGPYLIVTNHEPEPAEVIGVHVMDHPPSGNSHSLIWCPTAVTSTQVSAQLAYPVDVDSGTWDTTDSVSVEVPVGVAGLYRIESHTGDVDGGACGGGTLVAYSAPLQIAEVEPDLVIIDLQLLNAEEDRRSGYPLTFTVEIENQAPVAIGGTPFDVDLYLNLDDPPGQGQLGDRKQWLSALGPYESVVLTFTVQSSVFGDNNAYAQVDTTNYIDEGELGGEDNNVEGPLEFTLECGVPDANMSDDFDGGLGGQWSDVSVRNADGSYTVNGSGELEVTSKGSTIWNGRNSYYYIYQPIEGDFDARLRIIQEPTSSNWAKVGLHLRQYADDAKSPYLMNMATHDRSPAGSQAAYRDYYDGNGGRAGDDETVDLPVWMRVVRRDNTYDYYYSTDTDPIGDDWTHQGTHTHPNPLEYIGIAHASYNSGSEGTGIVDDFEICTESSVGGGPVHPPGLRECTELISIPGFEGNPETVFEYWKAGGPNAFQRTSQEFYRGSFGMRLHDSLGVYPCAQSNLQPYLYQEVSLPTEVYSISTFVVEGHYFVAESILECSPGGPDLDDGLYLRLQDGSGTDLTSPVVITNGGAITDTWHTIAIDLGESINLEDYAGQNVRIYWNGTHDEDYNGTFFYLDEMSAEVCTEWPIPDDVPDTASFGGLITTLGEYHAPVALPGAKVWAYAQGGDVYRTQSIQDGTYHFYNLPPDDYVIYAEAWVSGNLRTATTSITVAANERNYDVNLLLQ